MTKRDKINALAAHFTDGNYAALAKLLNVTPQTISNWRARDTFDAEVIHKALPAINPTWILSDDDEVEMFACEKSGSASPFNVDEVLNDLREQLHEKDRQINALLGIITGSREKPLQKFPQCEKGMSLIS